MEFHEYLSLYDVVKRHADQDVGKPEEFYKDGVRHSLEQAISQNVRGVEAVVDELIKI